MIKGIILDMDGVLVDNRDIHIEAFMLFCERYKCKVDREALMGVFGMGNDEIIPKLMPAEIVENNDMDAMSDEKEEIYRQIFAEKIAPTTGLVDFLIELRNKGYKCSVGSSGQRANVEYVLEKCKIAQYFDAAVNGDMVPLRKPNPDVFLMAANKLELKPEECLVFEDSFAGIEAAHRAGMKVVAVATTFSREQLIAEAKFDYLISDFTEMNCTIVEKL